MRLVIGIGGLKRCGKDTFALALREAAAAQGIVTVPIAFADALRTTAAAAYGVDVAEFTSDALKDEVHPDWGITRRQMLINLGVPATLLPPAMADHWVKRWRTEVSITLAAVITEAAEIGWHTEQHAKEAIVIAADIRRPNEAAAVHGMGGINVLVRRASVPNPGWDSHITERLSALASAARPSYTYGDAWNDRLDISETLMRGSPRSIFDYCVDNDETPAELAAKAQQLIKAVLDGK